MKITFLRLIMPVLLLVCFTGCDKEKELKSSSLTWEPCSGIQLGEAYSLVDVPAEGTSYALVCINAHVDWSGIWLNSVQVDGQNLALDEEKAYCRGRMGKNRVQGQVSEHGYNPQHYRQRASDRSYPDTNWLFLLF